MGPIPLHLLARGATSAVGQIKAAVESGGSFMNHLLGKAEQKTSDDSASAELELSPRALASELRRTVRDELSARGVPLQPPITISLSRSGKIRIQSEHPMRSRIEELFAGELAPIADELAKVSDSGMDVVI